MQLFYFIPATFIQNCIAAILEIGVEVTVLSAFHKGAGEGRLMSSCYQLLEKEKEGVLLHSLPRCQMVGEIVHVYLYNPRTSLTLDPDG